VQKVGEAVESSHPEAAVYYGFSLSGGMSSFFCRNHRHTPKISPMITKATVM
jgi:hypothetical protein